MSSSSSANAPVGVDMNNPSNLHLYSQILVFKTDTSREDVAIENLEASQQRSIQAIAHHFGLDYEYSKAFRTVRISRPDVPDLSELNDLEDGDVQLSRLDQFQYNSNSLNSVTTSTSPIPSSIFDSALTVDLCSTTPNNIYSYSGHYSGHEAPASPVSLLEQVEEMPSIMELSSHNPEIGTHVKRKHSGSGRSARSYISKGPWNAWRLSTRKKTRPDTPKDDHPSKVQPVAHSCSVCKITFLQEADLKRHEKSHLKQTRFQCPECVMGFMRRDLMLRHQQRVHSGPLYPPVSLNARKDQRRANAPGLRHNKGSPAMGIPEAGVLSPSVLPSSPEETDWTSELLTAPQTSRYNQTESKPSSTYSAHSEYDRSKQSSIFSGESAYSQTGSGFQELVFDSTSVYSGSLLSAASGRRGPLSDWARAGANAVKKVGACWRCKFLRKTCELETPCALCPRSDKSKWEAVGCRRGDFQPELPLNSLCRHNPLAYPAEEEKRAISALAASSQNATNRRDAWVRQEYNSDRENQRSPRIPEVSGAHQLLGQAFSNACNSVVTKPSPGALDPVKECVMAIMWELSECPLPIFDSVGGLNGLIQLMAPAAVYQARQENNQLISQSLICLRSCFEAIRKRNSGFITQYSHNYCSPNSRDCKVEYVATVNLHLQSYFNELSRVMFKKENIRKKNTCYLSIFYSFCIQSIVRKSLVMLASEDSTALVQSQRYLHIPLRLFIASSGTYDPLARDLLSFSGANDDHEQARLAVGYGEWCLSGVGDSGSYLKRLFEDDGSPIPTTCNHDHETERKEEQFENSDDMDLLGSADYLSMFWNSEPAAAWDEGIFGSP